VANTGESAQTFRVEYRGKYMTTTLQAGSVGTLVW
jgi:hypothetical protein